MVRKGFPPIKTLDFEVSDKRNFMSFDWKKVFFGEFDWSNKDFKKSHMENQFMHNYQLSCLKLISTLKIQLRKKSLFYLVYCTQVSPSLSVFTRKLLNTEIR